MSGDNRAALRAILRATKQDDVDAHTDCRRCGEFVHTDDGCDPTEFCHHCSQAVVIEVHAIAENALRPARRSRSAARRVKKRRRA